MDSVLEADVEDPAAFLVGQQVHLALAVPGLRLVQAVPLVGQRPERLGQDLQAGHVDGQLSPPAGYHLAGDSHPVAQVGQRLDGSRVTREVVSPEHKLNSAVGVLDGDEPELAVAPHGHYPPGDPRHLARPRVRLQPAVGRMQLGQRRAALEPGGIGIDALGLERIALGAALSHLRGQPSQGGGLGRLAALIGKDCGAHADVSLSSVAPCGQVHCQLSRAPRSLEKLPSSPPQEGPGWPSPPVLSSFLLPNGPPCSPPDPRQAAAGWRHRSTKRRSSCRPRRPHLA